MSERMRLGLLISGISVILLSLLLFISGATIAEDVTGEWRSTISGQGYTDSTYPADFTYDAKLTLNVGGSGSLWLKCTDVDINVAGWESALDAIGKSQTVSVDYTVFGSSVTLTIHDNYGGSYVLRVTVSGNRMTGSGSYVDISYTTNSWTMDLTKDGGLGSIGTPGIGGLATGLAIGGFLVGFAVSIIPPPRFMGGSIMPPSQTTLGTPYAPSQSLVLNHQISSMANQQPGGVTRPLPEPPRMRMQFEPIQFQNVEMGKTNEVRPTGIHQTDVLSKRSCPNCGSTLIATAAGWSCPFCNRAPPGGVDE